MSPLPSTLMAYAPRGIRGVVISTAWTQAEKLTFLTATALGRSDVTDSGQFLSLIETGAKRPTNPATRTDRRVLFVNPDTGTRVVLGDWDADTVDTMPAGGTETVLARMAAETTDLSIYNGDKWVEDEIA